jgi:hypothetical protein
MVFFKAKIAMKHSVRSAEYRLGDAISNKSSAYFAVAGSNAAS